MVTKSSPLSFQRRTSGAAASVAVVEPLDRRMMLSGTAHNWQNAQIVAGGYVTGITFSPTQQGTIYARTDIGGLYKTTDGGANWNPLLDFMPDGGGRGVLSVALAPQDPSTLYAQTGLSGNGYVLKSTDGGATFSQTRLSFNVGGNSNGRGTGERLAVDPRDHNVLLMGSQSSGIWLSTNAGSSFGQLSSFPANAAINFVMFDPNVPAPGQPSTMYVGLGSTLGLATPGSGPAPTNLYRSTDSGATWNLIPGGAASPGQSVATVAVTSLGRANGTATVQTASTHQLKPGDRVTISGATNTAYNGTFSVRNVGSPTSFTYSVATGTDSTAGTITAGANYSLMPNRAVIAPDGNMYLSYSDGLAPLGNQNAGGIFRYNTRTGQWANISPEVPGAGNNAQFGYVGIALDPQDARTLAVTSLNRYSATDQIWRTTNADATSPVWVGLFDKSSSRNFGFGGGNQTRDISNAPWLEPFGNGIGNWSTTVAFDPFNRARLFYGTGQGIWATDRATSSTMLSGANSWYFPDKGIEFTAVPDLVSPPKGVPLISALYDISGFAHTTLTSSPAQGSTGGGHTRLDFNQANPNYVVALGSYATGGGYSTNNGRSWTAFSARAGSGGGMIAVGSAASGTPTIVWAPTGGTAFYSNNNGATWTQSNVPAGALTSGRIYSDRVTPGTFYYITQNSAQNSFTTYVSTDGGANFTFQSSWGTGNTAVAVSPYAAGEMWLASYLGIHRTTNGGRNWISVRTPFQYGYRVAIGKPAPGRVTPTVFVYGRFNGTTDGYYRSDDNGVTWARINDATTQFGGSFMSMAADPNVYGRLYVGTNGRGILIADRPSELPAWWLDDEIGKPGNPGFARNSNTLSDGTVLTDWTVTGGGATPDQMHLASRAITGNVAVSARLKALGNPGVGTSAAGVIIRGGTGVGDVFVSLAQDANGRLLLTSRATAGGTVTTSAVGSASIGDRFLGLVRVGSTVTARVSSDGVNWTVVGSPATGVTLPSTARVGIYSTAGDNAQLAEATFSDVAVQPAPAFPQLPTSTPGTVSGTTALLSALAASEGGESVLTYAWSAAGPAAVVFSRNASNAAKSVTATFAKAGAYTFSVTATDANGLSATASVAVSVTQTASAVVVAPASVVTGRTTQSFAASVTDQFGAAMSAPVAWSATGPAAVSFSTGASTTATFTKAGTYAIRATVAGTALSSADASVTVTQTATSLSVTPANGPTVKAGGTLPFSAVVSDQFGAPMAASVAWSTTGATNVISPAGVFTPGNTSGNFTITAAAGAALATVPVTVDASIFTASQDIGTVGAVGSTDPVSGGVYTVRAAGADIWGTADAFRYTYLSLAGDGEIVARVTGVANTNAWAKAGVMIRASTATNAPHASLYVTPSNGVSFQRRTSTGGSSVSNTVTGLVAPYWVKMTRTSNTFTAFRSADGAAWTRVGNSVTISMGTTALFGLAVTSHVAGTLTTATFSNVRVTPLANLALNGPATASSTAGGSTAAAAVDGSTATAWASAAGGSQSLSVDLGRSAVASRVTLRWGTSFATVFKVQSSADGTTWADAYSTKAGAGAALDLTGLATAARYWRVSMTAGASASYSITDLTVTAA